MPKKGRYYFTRASVERALDERRLQEQAEAHGLKGSTYPTVAEAIQAAKENAGENDLIFIGGSSFVVADALPLFLG